MNAESGKHAICMCMSKCPVTAFPTTSSKKPDSIALEVSVSKVEGRFIRQGVRITFTCYKLGLGACESVWAIRTELVVRLPLSRRCCQEAKVLDLRVAGVRRRERLMDDSEACLGRIRKPGLLLFHVAADGWFFAASLRLRVVKSPPIAQHIQFRSQA